MERLIQQVLDQYPNKVKLVVKNFPLPQHRFAREAAWAALAANLQGKFWEFRSRLFEHFWNLNDAELRKIAKGLGLDMKKFVADMNSPSIHDMVSRDISNGREIGVSGTPTIFVNGQRARIRTPSDLIDIIDRELAEKKG